jgi:hypothetical protein
MVTYLPSVLSPNQKVDLDIIWCATNYIADPTMVGELVLDRPKEVQAFQDTNQALLELRDTSLEISSEATTASVEANDLAKQYLKVHFAKNGIKNIFRKRRAARYLADACDLAADQDFRRDFAHMGMQPTPSS